jgi:hypothetical protein
VSVRIPADSGTPVVGDVIFQNERALAPGFDLSQ